MTTPTPTATVELLRQMQWWVLTMAADALTDENVGLPQPPPLDDSTAVMLRLWLQDCAAVIAPDIDPRTRVSIGVRP